MTLPDDAKARKAVPLYSGVHQFFPAALAGMARVSVAGSRQHHGPGELYDDRAKSNDDADCLLRHLADSAIGDGMDGDVPHIDKVLWRAARLSQKWHEARGAPVAPAARNLPVAPGATNAAKAAPFPFPPPAVFDEVHAQKLSQLLDRADEDAPTANLKAGEAHEHDHAAYVAATAAMAGEGS